MSVASGRQVAEEESGQNEPDSKQNEREEPLFRTLDFRLFLQIIFILWMLFFQKFSAVVQVNGQLLNGSSSSFPLTGSRGAGLLFLEDRRQADEQVRRTLISGKLHKQEEIDRVDRTGREELLLPIDRNYLQQSTEWQSNDNNEVNLNSNQSISNGNRPQEAATKSISSRMRRRSRRHAASPGTVQLQEARRKSALENSNNNRNNGAHKTRQVIHAMLKGQVVIPCNLQPPEADDSVSLVLWYKDKSMVPIYSVDARSSPIQEARHKPGPWLEGRSSLKIVLSNGSGTSKSRSRRHATGSSEDDNISDSDSNNNNNEPNNKSTDYYYYFEDFASVRRRRLQRDGSGSTSGRAHSPALTRNRKSSSSSSSGGGSSSRYRLPEPDESGWQRVISGGPMTQQSPAQAQSLRPMALTLASSSGSKQQPDSSGGGNESQQQLVAHLHVDSLSSEDNGLYLCRVDFRKARSRTQESMLRIIVPADKPVVRDLSLIAEDSVARGQTQHAPQLPPRPPMGPPPSPNSADITQSAVQVIGPHNEGSRLELVCETQGGYPEPTLTWWRNGRLIDDSYELVSASDGLVIGRHPGSLDTSGGGSLVDEPLAQPAAELDSFRLNRVASSRSDESSGDSGSDGGFESAASGSGLDQEQEQTAAAAMQVTTGEGVNSIGGGKQELAGTGSSQNRLIRNRLELRSLSRADLMANYSCQAWNTKLSEPPATSIMIDMNLRPVKVQIENERLPVQADRPVEIVCRAQGSRPAALISWWLSGRRLQPTSSGSGADEGRQVQIREQVSADLNATSSTLTLVPKADDGGQLVSCRAENPYMTATGSSGLLPGDELSAGSGHQNSLATIEDSWKLEVHYLPRVKLALGDKLHQAQIQEGHDVYFECSVKSLPSAHEIRWWFDGRELETNVSSGVIISNQSLVLQRVGRQQRGRYTCSAINSVGESHSNSVHLRVQHAPVCRDSPTQQAPDGQLLSAGRLHSHNHHYKSHYGAARLETVRVHCHIDADPAESIAYKWAFVATSGSKQQPQRTTGGGGQRLEFSGQQLVYLDQSLVGAGSSAEDPLSSVASYTPRTDLDYGTLLCWGQNSLGRQVEPCVYQVVPAERPEPMRNCRLVNASDIQLTVACEPGYDGGVDQSFQMEVWRDLEPHGRQLVANVSSSSSGGLNLELIGGAGAGGSGDPAATSNELVYWPADKQQPPATGRNSSEAASGEPASLISEPAFVSRQQKQRHSSAFGQRPAAATYQQQGEEPAAGSQQQPAETLFITEPNLRPATNYYLSIYSTNSKGSSRPVAFTATTMNLSSSLLNNNELDFFGASTSLVRDARRNSGDASHLLSDVLALSWSPFLMIGLASLLLFIMFASITFAMMKYVDFSAGFSLSSASVCGATGSGSGGRQEGASGAASRRQTNSSSNSSSASSSSFGGGGSSGTRAIAEGQRKLGKQKLQRAAGTGTEDDDDCDGCSESREAGEMTGDGIHRARVVTCLASDASDQQQPQVSPSLAACGLQLNRRQQSVDNGNSMSINIKGPLFAADGQLMGYAGGRLKQSSSDHFIDQVDQALRNFAGPKPNPMNLGGNQHCGTLPKNTCVGRTSLGPLAQAGTISSLAGFNSHWTGAGDIHSNGARRELDPQTGSCAASPQPQVSGGWQMPGEQLVAGGSGGRRQTLGSYGGNRNSYQQRHLQVTAASVAPFNCSSSAQQPQSRNNSNLASYSSSFFHPSATQSSNSATPSPLAAAATTLVATTSALSSNQNESQQQLVCMSHLQHPFSGTFKQPNGGGGGQYIYCTNNNSADCDGSGSSSQVETKLMSSGFCDHRAAQNEINFSLGPSSSQLTIATTSGGDVSMNQLAIGHNGNTCAPLNNSNNNSNRHSSSSDSSNLLATIGPLETSGGQFILRTAQVNGGRSISASDPSACQLQQMGGDSDGLSSGTQRSLVSATLTTTTTGSPSSADPAQCDQHKLYATNQSPADNNNNNNFIDPLDQAKSFGNLIGVSTAGNSYGQQVKQAPEVQRSAPKSQAQVRKTRNATATSGLRPLKKNNLVQYNGQDTGLEFSQFNSLHEPQILDQYTMFVNGNEFQLTDASNQEQDAAQFYVLPADLELQHNYGQVNHSGHRTRVRLMGGGGHERNGSGGHEHSHLANHLTNNNRLVVDCSSPTSSISISDEMHAIEANGLLPTTSSGQKSNNKPKVSFANSTQNKGDLHTDV